MAGRPTWMSEARTKDGSVACSARCERSVLTTRQQKGASLSGNQNQARWIRADVRIRRRRAGSRRPLGFGLLRLHRQHMRDGLRTSELSNHPVFIYGICAVERLAAPHL